MPALYRYDTSPKYSILKRGQSVFLEGDLEQPHISRFDSLIEPDKPDSSVKKVGRPTLGSSKSVENIGRPTLLSVMIGVHWKHAGQCLHMKIHVHACNMHCMRMCVNVIHVHVQ